MTDEVYYRLLRLRILSALSGIVLLVGIGWDAYLATNSVRAVISAVVVTTIWAGIAELTLKRAHRNFRIDNPKLGFYDLYAGLDQCLVRAGQHRWRIYAVASTIAWATLFVL